MKKAFCKMFVTICRSFHPDEGAVAGYGNRIRVKCTAKWGAQIAGTLFQTRSGVARHAFLPIPSISRIPLDQYRYLQNDVRAYSYSVKFLCSRQFNSFFQISKKDPCPVLFTGKDLFYHIFSATTLQYPLKSLSFLFQYYLLKLQKHLFQGLLSQRFRFPLSYQLQFQMPETVLLLSFYLPDILFCL